MNALKKNTQTCRRQFYRHRFFLKFFIRIPIFHAVQMQVDFSNFEPKMVLNDSTRLTDDEFVVKISSAHPSACIFYSFGDAIILQNIIQGKVVGERGPGRRRISWLRNLRTVVWVGKSSAELFRAATNKIMIANIQSGQVLEEYEEESYEILHGAKLL